MSANDAVTKNTSENNPEELSRLLELELIQKRAIWEQTIARNKNIRSVSLLFLAVVFFAGIGVFFFVYMNACGERPRQQRPAETTTSPTNP
jgi:hypothetical protein